MRLRRAVATLLGALLSASLASAASAAEPVVVHCGQVIVRDTKLANDLTNCPDDGLEIGASGVDLDLNGHTVDGDGNGDDVGIQLSGHSGVTVERGVVRQFADGVFVADSQAVSLRRLVTIEEGHGGIHVADSRDLAIEGNTARSDIAGVIVSRSTGVRVKRNSMEDTEAGIVLFAADRATVVDNQVDTSRSSAGIGVYDGSTQNTVARNRVRDSAAGVGLDNGASANSIEGNTLARNDSGVIVDVGTHDNRVVRNRIDDSGFEGIAVVGSDGNLIASNRLARNGGFADAGGISVIALPDDPSETSDGNTVALNILSENVGDGIYVGAGLSNTLVRDNRSDRNSDDGIDVDSAGTTLMSNVTNRNRDLGIEAVPGVADGGGNRASGNGNPQQCANVFCKGG